MARRGLSKSPAIWGLAIWGAALLAYLLFLGWYVNWQGPMTPREIDAVMARYINNTPPAQQDSAALLRTFLEQDDGREFYMVNLVRIAPGPVAKPGTGEMIEAQEALDGYSSMFMPALMTRAGHPAVLARKVGPYLDSWGVEADPGWTVFAYIRYRSRRDLALLASDPRFASAHEFKFAAMPQTFAFPARPMPATFLGPAIWVGLVLALIASLAHLLLVLRIISGASRESGNELKTQTADLGRAN